MVNLDCQLDGLRDASGRGEQNSWAGLSGMSWESIWSLPLFSCLSLMALLPGHHAVSGCPLQVSFNKYCLFLFNCVCQVFCPCNKNLTKGMTWKNKNYVFSCQVKNRIFKIKAESLWLFVSLFLCSFFLLSSFLYKELNLGHCTLQVGSVPLNFISS